MQNFISFENNDRAMRIVVILIACMLLFTACATNGLQKEAAPLCQQSGGIWEGKACSCPAGMVFTSGDGCAKAPA
jgi:hypothetical protein